MTDWDKLKEEKQRSISLCEARNGAILLLKDVRSDKWDSLYKETVRNLFKLNSEHMLYRKIFKQGYITLLIGYEYPMIK